MATNLVGALRLMLVTDDGVIGRDPVGACEQAARGGVTSVQLRLKHASPRELIGLLRALKSRLQIPVIVNDRLDVALAGGADGVHLGPDDVPVAVARRIVPQGFIVGTSVGSEDETHNGAGADYWGIGPYRTSQTKVDAGESIGLSGLRHFVALAPAGIPCIAIGGVEPTDVPAILSAGAAGVAVVSGILASSDVEEAARRYALALGNFDR
jgi:thiamine-phosphate pyrophosphorylase